MNERKLKICFTSDVHGYFYPTTYGDLEKKPVGLFQCVGGFEKDEDTLIIDGGDMLQGSAFAYYCRQTLRNPEKIAEIMNDCGYDFYTLGNHDFNYGQEYQAMYRNAHKGQCVCQNVTDLEGNVLYPYVIHTMKNGLRLGMVGIVTDYINVWEKEENLVGVRVTDPFEAAQKAIAELKGKVDLIIGIYHGGFERDLETGEVVSETTENIGYRLCEELEFDILLTGHQHMSIDGQYVHGTYVVQPVENAKEYHYIEVSSNEEGHAISSKRRQATSESGQLLEKYMETEQAIQTWLDQPLGHLSREIRPDDKITMALNGSPIADFLNMVQLHFTDAQLSSVGLANQITGFAKEVSVRNIISTYPYPNTLVVCEITGAQLKRAMERSAEYFAVDEKGELTVSDSFLKPKIAHYNYDYYAGVSYEIDPLSPEGARIKNLCYEGAAVKDEDVFTLCLNNYRYTGTGGYEVYQECKTVKEINTEMVELIMEYFNINPSVTI